MLNSGHKVVAMLVGVALMTLGCGDKELETLESEAGGSMPALAWAEVLQQNPDSTGDFDADLRRGFIGNKLPWRVKDKASGIEMLLVLPGMFVMGMSPGDSEATSSERPSHEVTITKPFYLGRTEVTAEQWVKVMGVNPSKAELGSSERSQLLTKYMSEGRTKAEANQLADNHPAIAISWDECQKFCAKVGLNLPTEAQWEFACRAGLREPTYGRLELVAVFKQNAAGGTHPVGRTNPNSLGFYDMLGNVSEWCEDWYDSDYYKSCENGVVDPSGPESGEFRVLRGGSWLSNANNVRASYRGYATPGNAFNDFGFRVARAP